MSDNKNIEYAELTEYHEHENQIRENLEAKYTHERFQGDIEAAYETLGKLMALKLIPLNDSRIDAKNSQFKSAGIDKDHRFRYDYRTNSSFIAEWLYGELLNNKTIKVTRAGHWSKRLEGNYDGDQYYPPCRVDVRISFCNSTRLVDNAMDEIERINKECKLKRINLDKLRVLAKAGVYRLYSVVCDSAPTKCKIIAYAIFKATDDGIKFYTIFDTESLISNWMIIREVVPQICNEISTFDKDGAKALIVNDFADAVKKQTGMLKISSDTEVANKAKMQAFEEKKAERAAKRAAREAAKAFKETVEEQDQNISTEEDNTADVDSTDSAE